MAPKRSGREIQVDTTGKERGVVALPFLGRKSLEKYSGGQGSARSVFDQSGGYQGTWGGRGLIAGVMRGHWFKGEILAAASSVLMGG